MTPPDLRLINRAKLGDADAIALLMNRHLQNKGFTPYVRSEGSTLRIKLEGVQSPDQTAAVQFIHRGITNLLPVGVKDVHLSGGRVDQVMPDWDHKFRVYPQPEVPEVPTIEEVPLGPVRELRPDSAVILDVDQALDQVKEPQAPPEPPFASIVKDIDASLLRSDGYGGEFFLETELETENFSTTPQFFDNHSKPDPQLDLNPDPQLVDPQPGPQSVSQQNEPSQIEGLLSPVTATTSSKLLGGTITVGLVYTVVVSAVVVLQLNNPAVRLETVTDPEIKTASANGSSKNSANATLAPADSPFREGVNLAMEAVVITQSARTEQDWQRAADLWQKAERAMGKVSNSDPKYAIALERVAQYRRNYRYANQKRLEAMAP